MTQVLDKTDITEFVAVFDLRNLQVSCTPIVFEIASWCRENEYRCHRRLHAAAIILQNAFWMRAVSACVWSVTSISRPACSLQMVSSPEEAEAFLVHELEALAERLLNEQLER